MRKGANIELEFVAWRLCFFQFLGEVYLHLLNINQTNVTPIPTDVAQAVEEELEEPWMERLVQFVRERLQPAPKPTDATEAANIHQAFYDFCGGEVPMREVGLKMRQRGFCPDTVNFYAGIKRSKKRVYAYNTDDGPRLMMLREGSTGGCG